MNQSTVRVLLIGESENGSSYLRGQLESRGCSCWFAQATEKSVASFAPYSFHLILSTTPLHQFNRLLTELGGSNCTVFYSCPVEDGCWWLPVVRRGQKCLGAPALRPSEFIRELDQMVKKIQIEVVTAA
jgi:hypothetical protein